MTTKPQDDATRHRAVAIPCEKAKEIHEKMGFQAGWGAALDQMVSAVMR